jgi:hypothetical protein
MNAAGYESTVPSDERAKIVLPSQVVSLYFSQCLEMEERARDVCRHQAAVFQELPNRNCRLRLKRKKDRRRRIGASLLQRGGHVEIGYSYPSPAACSNESLIVNRIEYE